MSKRDVDWWQGLTQRQMEACKWVSTGMTNDEIAQTMKYRTSQSVKNLLRDAAKILGTDNRVKIALMVHGITKRKS